MKIKFSMLQFTFEVPPKLGGHCFWWMVSNQNRDWREAEDRNPSLLTWFISFFACQLWTDRSRPSEQAWRSKNLWLQVSFQFIHFWGFRYLGWTGLGTGIQVDWVVDWSTGHSKQWPPNFGVTLNLIWSMEKFIFIQITSNRFKKFVMSVYRLGKIQLTHF